MEQFWPRGIFAGELPERTHEVQFTTCLAVRACCGVRQVRPWKGWKNELGSTYSHGRSNEHGGKVFVSSHEMRIEAFVNSVESARIS